MVAEVSGKRKKAVGLLGTGGAREVDISLPGTLSVPTLTLGHRFLRQEHCQQHLRSFSISDALSWRIMKTCAISAQLSLLDSLATEDGRFQDTRHVSTSTDVG